MTSLYDDRDTLYLPGPTKYNISLHLFPDGSHGINPSGVDVDVDVDNDDDISNDDLDRRSSPTRSSSSEKLSSSFMSSSSFSSCITKGSLLTILLSCWVESFSSSSSADIILSPSFYTRKYIE